MGRPLNKKYFANTNYQDFGSANVGGEALASVALGTAGSGYSQGLTATVSAPQITGGEQATVSVAVNSATGAITGYTVTAGGSGYTSATITLVKPDNAVTDATFTTGSADIEVADATGIYVGMRATSTNISSNQTVTDIDGTTITLSAVPDGNGTDEEVTFSDVGASGVAGTRTLTSGAAARQNGIKCETQYGSGDSEITTGDIVKQEGSKRYKVQTSQGTGFFKLVTTEAKAAGEMSIMATDSDGGTYLVAKLTARKAVLVPVANAHGGSSSAGAQFASGTTAKWTFGSAVAGTTVTISNQ